MKTAGIICEFNPLHRGHIYLMEQWRSSVGEETAVICVMSGNYVQRGEPALLRKHARAEAAVRSGADLVLELPTAWALSSAEGFARAGVSLLTATGVTDTLLFGSECGELSSLQLLAQTLEEINGNDFRRQMYSSGEHYAAVQQELLTKELGEERASLLRQPNNVLAVEYLKALQWSNSLLQPCTVLRSGAGHHQLAPQGESCSAGALRHMALRGEEICTYLPEAMAEMWQRECAAGRAPVQMENMERSVLSKLRSMNEEDFIPYDGGQEGLHHRFYQAVQNAVSVEQLLQQVKTRRYPMARLRRMLLRAYLGLEAVTVPPAYLRVLACNAKGRTLLREMKKKAALPVLTKPADVRRLGEAALSMFQSESRCTDLYVLAYPQLEQAGPGSEWRTDPVIVR